MFIRFLQFYWLKQLIHICMNFVHGVFYIAIFSNMAQRQRARYRVARYVIVNNVTTATLESKTKNAWKRHWQKRNGNRLNSLYLRSVKVAVTVTAAKVVKLAAIVKAATVVKLAATATAANSEHFWSSIFYFSITWQAYPKTGRTLQTELFYHTCYLSYGRKSHYFCCKQ